MTIITTGVVGAGEVLVTYDAEGLGIPTLAFNAGDGVTECDIVMNQTAADFWLYLEEPDAG